MAVFAVFVLSKNEYMANPMKERLTGINKIVFLLSSPFNKRDEGRFGIELLQKNGFEVELWDFTAFINPELAKKFTPPDKIDFKKCYVFSTRKMAISAISELTTNCLIIPLLDVNFQAYYIYRAISKYKLKYCLLAYSFPSYDLYRKKSIFKKLKNITPAKLLKYLLGRIPYKFFGIKSADMLMALGGRIDTPHFPVNKKTDIIRLSYFDYDIYLKELQKSVKVDEKRGVFLDIFLPFHPDGISGTFISPEEYYPSLCNFFDYLEKKHGVHMVIAAHPRSNYEKHPDYFGGRPVVREKTAELVRSSGFVVLHQSASVSFAVLFKKPMIFVTLDFLLRDPGWAQVGALTDFMASLFNKKPINLNCNPEIDLSNELIVDEAKYSNYRNTYIKRNGANDAPIWQAFADHVKNVY